MASLLLSCCAETPSLSLCLHMWAAAKGSAPLRLGVTEEERGARIKIAGVQALHGVASCMTIEFSGGDILQVDAHLDPSSPRLLRHEAGFLDPKEAEKVCCCRGPVPILGMQSPLLCCKSVLPSAKGLLWWMPARWRRSR